MEKISNNELKQINGGGFGLGLLIGGLATFVIGVIDGFVSPLRCK